MWVGGGGGGGLCVCVSACVCVCVCLCVCRVAWGITHVLGHKAHPLTTKIRISRSPNEATYSS